MRAAGFTGETGTKVGFLQAVTQNKDAIDILNSGVTVEGSVLKSIKDNAVTGSYDSEETYDAGTIGAALKSKQGNLTAGDGIAISATDVISTKLGSGLVFDDDAQIAVNVDNVTLEVDGTSGKVQIKDDAVTTDMILNDAVTLD